MTANVAALFFALLALSACAATTAWRAQEGVDYSVEVADEPVDRRFDLVFVSLAQRPLCFSSDSWPFRGKVGWSSDQIAVEIAGQRYPIADWNPGVCVIGNGCASRVEAGERATGFISYDEFPAAPINEATERLLHFSIAVYACHGGEQRT